MVKEFVENDPDFKKQTKIDPKHIQTVKKFSAVSNMYPRVKYSSFVLRLMLLRLSYYNYEIP